MSEEKSGVGVGGSENATFEEAFKELESIVRKLEGGDVKLEESLKLFEEGVRLARACSAKLDAAEGKIRLLLEGEDGSPVEAPFDDLPGAASS